ncbi:sigma-E processing peptidase SpoIIGA [Alkalicella caledoniensis]|nr:sigma-E processing peptidase SpoIIGA [Alkalicella caledoniensis]
MYLDLTFIVNFLLCYIILQLQDFIYPQKIPFTRKVIASIVGSSYSILLMLWPNIFNNLLIKTIFFLLIVYIVFGNNPLASIIKKGMSLLIVSFIGAGLLYWMMLERDGPLFILNPILDARKITVIIILFVGLVIFPPMVRIFIISVKSLFNNKNLYCDLEILMDKSVFSIKGFVDTGNSLYDPITKLPVVIARGKIFKNYLGEEWTKWFEQEEMWFIPTNSKQRVFFVPFRSMGGEEMLVAIKPKEVSLINKGKKTKVECLIALCLKEKRMHPEFDALIHPSIVF